MKIKNETEYNQYLEIIEKLMDIECNDESFIKKVEPYLKAVEDWEEEHYKIPKLVMPKPTKEELNAEPEEILKKFNDEYRKQVEEPMMERIAKGYLKSFVEDYKCNK